MLVSRLCTLNKKLNNSEHGGSSSKMTFLHHKEGYHPFPNLDINSGHSEAAGDIWSNLMWMATN